MCSLISILRTFSIVAQAEPKNMRELWRSATLGVTQMLDSMKVLQESTGVLDPREANNVWDLSNLLDSHLLQVNPPSVNPRD